MIEDKNEKEKLIIVYWTLAIRVKLRTQKLKIK